MGEPGNDLRTRRSNWILVAVGLIAGVQLAILIGRWLRRSSAGAHVQPTQSHTTRPTDHLVANGPLEDLNPAAVSKTGAAAGTDARLDPIIKDLYLEITNIAQGANIAILVYSITARSFLASLTTGYLSPAIFAIASLLIVVVFWARYYLDTGILERSFTVPAAIWFFAYAVAQGVSISFISTPWAWLAGTGVFLFFGFGFYVLNLSEIRRKQRAGMMPECSAFVDWQTRRMIELAVLSPLSLSTAVLVIRQPALALPAAIFAVGVATWQLAITRDYRRLRFLRTGV